MPSKDFEPKPGRIRSKPGAKSQRYVNRVIRNIRIATQRRTGSRKSSFTGSRIGRGYTQAAALTLRSFQPSRRRVIVKTRYTSLRNGLSAAKAHLRYLQRDGVTPDGQKGELYGRENEHIDIKDFFERSDGDRHQFRIIVAPEDGAEFTSLRPFIRDLMEQAESDMGTKLEWVAVDHFNTGHPHTHIVIRGRDDKGGDLIIARDYISQGLRERARDIATLELGPQSEDGFQKKMAMEIQAERFTSIDRSILKDTIESIFAGTTKQGMNHRQLALRMGRLNKLKSMGLAEEVKPGVWRLQERTETVLRQLGQRGDIIKTMQHVLKQADMDRGAADYKVFDPAQANSKAVGRIVALGLSNELQDEYYVVVDGVDGKIHYAEIGRPSKYDPPAKDMVVTLRPSNRLQAARQPTARLFIESHVPFQNLATAEGATWLDRKLLSKNGHGIHNKGFAAEAIRALRLRQQWLIKEEFLNEQNGQLVASRNMLQKLQQREVTQVARKLQKELGLEYQPTAAGEAIKGRITKSLKLASGRFAVLQKGKAFSLVPWRKTTKLKNSIGISLPTKSGPSL